MSMKITYTGDDGTIISEPITGADAARMNRARKTISNSVPVSIITAVLFLIGAAAYTAADNTPVAAVWLISAPVALGLGFWRRHRAQRDVLTFMHEFQTRHGIPLDPENRKVTMRRTGETKG
ncbi:hypothetical protein [Aeromicrobium sp. 179-A 4D2 NHS]|uniref:hypothetical protein n=1 Tax=Aeromicrobium sp. 179-A 4D2 NHS TaxID=3142375 RepID=UPI00399F93FF